LEVYLQQASHCLFAYSVKSVYQQSNEQRVQVAFSIDKQLETWEVEGSNKPASTLDFGFNSPTLMVLEQPRGRFTDKITLYPCYRSSNSIIHIVLVISRLTVSVYYPLTVSEELNYGKVS
jgi:hypothetical protein